MRLPFLKRRSDPEAEFRKLAAKATRVGSAEAPSPRLQSDPTFEELRAAGRRTRAIRANGAQPT
jgi:hypothetical protein